MINVLITGGNGQLALSIRKVSKSYSNFNFIYTDVEELDISRKEEIVSFFRANDIDYCINCAAYTDVDKAESDIDNAHRINVEGARNLAESCMKFGAILIHISTDFVFNGESNQAYKEKDKASPLSIYGQTKLDGEKAIKSEMENFFIIRTSWLYSEFGNNFMKTIIRLGNERSELSVVNDQIGSPTYAQDLAKVILSIIDSGTRDFGLYHYSNKGIVSWYDFAKEIFFNENIKIELKTIPTSRYPTPAKRPKYSVLDTSRINNILSIDIPNWKDSLKNALKANREL